jgi:pimeloyl-ACP methyl ester carboxylesterase
LILLHGGRDHCRNWDWVAEALREDYHIIAPDLRGHGDSAWASDGNYPMLPYVYDLAQLVHQLDLAPVSIVAHSLGGNIALRYTGLYPDQVRRLVAIEGLGPSPGELAKRAEIGPDTRLREWIEGKRKAAGRTARRYPSFDDALARMRDANSHLSDEQLHHLTIHAVSRNEDGSYSWKFDPHVHIWNHVDISQAALESIWGAITCPTLLCYGDDSWASNPDEDGRLQYFDTASVSSYADAGHWLHHDQFDQFVAEIRAFL